MEVVAGALYAVVDAIVWGAGTGVGAGADTIDGAGAGSGVPHASLEPHASILLMAEKLLDCAAGLGGAEGAGADRLNAAFAVYDDAFIGGGLAEGVGAGAGAGPDRSNRSPIVEAAGGAALKFDTGAVTGGFAEVKSPKSPNPLDIRCVCGLRGGGGLF